MERIVQMKFSPSVIKTLKHYVYLYSHSSTGEVFNS